MSMMENKTNKEQQQKRQNTGQGAGREGGEGRKLIEMCFPVLGSPIIKGLSPKKLHFKS